VTDALELDVASAVTCASDVAVAVTVVAPALILVFTFISCPPYGVVTFMILVTGLGPLRSAVAMEVSL